VVGTAWREPVLKPRYPAADHGGRADRGLTQVMTN
jgi:hypothetical protein